MLLCGTMKTILLALSLSLSLVSCGAIGVDLPGLPPGTIDESVIPTDITCEAFGAPVSEVASCPGRADVVVCYGWEGDELGTYAGCTVNGALCLHECP